MMKQNNNGLLLCARYSVAPNYFGYCGPDENKNLLDHLRENIADVEVEKLLSEFETLFLNLTLIAYENNISDVFDRRVVEAYWLGNPLLNNIRQADYASLLKERFNLGKKIGKNNYLKLQYKLLTNQILPHHSFHVFNIFKRTGNDPSFHTLTTMDECRIGWGKVIKTSKLRQKYEVVVEALPLENVMGRLEFGLKRHKAISVDYKGKTFLNDLKIGDWISYHWSFACDKITSGQIKNLEYYTQKAINFYNNK